MSDVVTPEELRAIVAAGERPTKYRSRRTAVPEMGRTFASRREAEAAFVLWRRQLEGEVRNLSFQVPFRLEVDGELICVYVADFVYEEKRPTDPGVPAHADLWYWSAPVVADAKGFPTPVYRIKAKLMKAILGITIEEI